MPCGTVRKRRLNYAQSGAKPLALRTGRGVWGEGSLPETLDMLQCLPASRAPSKEF